MRTTYNTGVIVYMATATMALTSCRPGSSTQKDRRSAQSPASTDTSSAGVFPGDPAGPNYPTAPKPAAFGLGDTYGNCAELQSDVRKALLYKKASDEARAAAQGQRDDKNGVQANLDSKSSNVTTPAPAQAESATPSVMPGEEDTPYTNVQERAIDEPDHTKVGQDHVFVMGAGTVHVSHREPLAYAGQLNFPAGSELREMLVTKDYLFVLRVKSRNKCFEGKGREEDDADKDLGGVFENILGTAVAALVGIVDPVARAKPGFQRSREPKQDLECYTVATTSIDAFRLENGKLPTHAKTWDFKGSYVNSRMLSDGRLVLIFNQMLNLAEPIRWILTDSKRRLDEVPAEPIVLSGDESRGAMGCSHFLKSRLDDMDFRVTKVSVINTSNLAWEPQQVGFIGGGDQVYMTGSNLYIAKTGRLWTPFDAKETVPMTDALRITQVSLGEFGRLAETLPELRGRPKDVWAFKEITEADATRLAVFTTTGDLWQGPNRAANQLWILREDGQKLDIETSIQDIAPGEDIRSIRYVGGWAYAVTFKKTDPLFAFDLTKPSAPKLVGELKIPGFSTYLHPVGPGRLIGLGYDVWVDPNSTEDDAVKFQGLKLSLFDVTDPTAMKEIDSVVLGERGSYSDAIADHHGFHFDPASGRVAFPVTLLKSPSKSTPWQTQREVLFSGAVFFGVGGDSLVELGRLSHDSFVPDRCRSEMAKGQWWQSKIRSLDVNRIYRLGDDYLAASRFGLATYAVDGDLGGRWSERVKVEFPENTFDCMVIQRAP